VPTKWAGEVFLIFFFYLFRHGLRRATFPGGEGFLSVPYNIIVKLISDKKKPHQLCIHHSALKN
jgi:hypothetical protein